MLSSCREAGKGHLDGATVTLLASLVEAGIAGGRTFDAIIGECASTFHIGSALAGAYFATTGTIGPNCRVSGSFAMDAFANRRATRAV